MRRHDFLSELSNGWPSTLGIVVVVWVILVATVAVATTVLSGIAVNVKDFVVLVCIANMNTCLCTLLTASFVLRTMGWNVYVSRDVYLRSIVSCSNMKISERQKCYIDLPPDKEGGRLFVRKGFPIVSFQALAVVAHGVGLCNPTGLFCNVRLIIQVYIPGCSLVPAMNV